MNLKIRSFEIIALKHVSTKTESLIYPACGKTCKLKKIMSPIEKEKILAVAERYGVYNIRIFGSYARGDDRPDSDIDILIDLEEGRSLLDLIAIQQDLEDLLGRKVDV